jgi:outer membrane protein TolC
MNTMRSKIYLFLGMFFLLLASPLHAEESLTWHPDLSSALALLQQAEADKRITGGALLPKLSLDVRSEESGTTVKGSSPSAAHSYSLTAQQLLFDGHKTSSQVASRKEAIKGAQYNYDVVSADLRFALRTAFTQLLKAQELVGLVSVIRAGVNISVRFARPKLIWPRRSLRYHRPKGDLCLPRPSLLRRLDVTAIIR